MARPTTVKLHDGEVTLKGFSKERTEELKKLLTGNKSVITEKEAIDLIKIQPSLPASPTLVFAPEDDLVSSHPNLDQDEIVNSISLKNLPYNAVGVHRDNHGSFILVTIKYSNDVAMIDLIKDLGKDRYIANHDIKIEVAKKLL